MADTWKGLKTLTSENSYGQSQSSMTTGERRTFSNDLSDFFCGYENIDHNLNMSDLINRTSVQSPYDGFTINKEDVKKVFIKVCWPRWCMLQITKCVCSSTLSGVFHTVYMVLERWHCSRCMENFHDLSYSQKQFTLRLIRQWLLSLWHQ